MQRIGHLHSRPFTLLYLSEALFPFFPASGIHHPRRKLFHRLKRSPKFPADMGKKSGTQPIRLFGTFFPDMQSIHLHHLCGNILDISFEVIKPVAERLAGHDMIFEIEVLSITMPLIANTLLRRTSGMEGSHKLSDYLCIFPIHQFQIIQWIHIL